MGNAIAYCLEKGGNNQHFLKQLALRGIQEKREPGMVAVNMLTAYTFSSTYWVVGRHHVSITAVSLRKNIIM